MGGEFDPRGAFGGSRVLGADEMDARPPVGDLPAKVRRQQGECDLQSDPGASGAQHRAWRGERKTEGKGHAEGGDRVLGLETETGDYGQEGPEPRLGSDQYPQSQVEEGAPGEQVEPGRMEDRGRAEDVGGERPETGGAELGAQAAAELPDHQRDQDHGADAAGHAGQAQDIERVPGHQADHRAEVGNQRRKIDVAEGQVPGGREVVELVALPAVAAEERGGEEDQDRGAGEARTRLRRSDVRSLIVTPLAPSTGIPN